LRGLRGRPQPKDLSQCKKILVVRTDEIGDVVLTSPLLRELRRNAPGASITLVVKPEVRNLVELCPYVDEILTYDWRTSGRHWLFQRHLRAFRLARTSLWNRRFDCALIPRFDTDYYYATLIAYMSGARRRISYSELVSERKAELNLGYDSLLSDAMRGQANKHEIELAFDVLRTLGGKVVDRSLEVWLNDDDKAHADAIIAQSGHFEQRRLIALGLGAGAPYKMWPLENFIGLGKWLARIEDAQLLLVGGPQERVLGREFAAKTGGKVLDCCGQLTLRQTAALLGRCSLYIGNDTGVMHLAAAQKVPVVEISCHPASAPADHVKSPVRFGPWEVPCVILQPKTAQAPCTDSCHAEQAHCIRGVTVEEAQDAVARLLPSPELAKTF
jgi:heptosyltransferase-2